MKLTKEKIEGFDLDDSFREFWKSECKGKNIKHQFEIVYNKMGYRWFEWLILQVLPEDKNKKFLVFAAELALQSFEKIYPNNNIPRKTIVLIKSDSMSNEDIDIIEDCSYQCGNLYHEFEGKDGYYNAWAATQCIWYLSRADIKNVNSTGVVLLWCMMCQPHDKYDETEQKIYEYGIKLLEEK